VVQVDETYTEFQAGANTNTPRRGEQYSNVVITLVERGGSARSFHVDGTTVAEIAPDPAQEHQPRRPPDDG